MSTTKGNTNKAGTSKANTSKAPAKKTVKTKKKIARTVPVGIAFVKATFNNTIVAITDQTGQVVAWSSAGKSGYTGSRKSSAFAATMAAQDAAKIAMNMGMRDIEVKLKGPGAGREPAVRGLQSAGLNVTIISDDTPVAHNGCRPRKRRRV